MSQRVAIKSSHALLMWRIKRSGRAMDLSGVIGIVALLLAGGYYLLRYVPLANEVEQLKQAYAVSSSKPSRFAADEAGMTPQRQLGQFYSRLRREAEVPEVLRGLHKGARNAGLRFVRGDYRPQRDASGTLLRYQITLPVKGGYPKVRRFLAQAMRDEPALALDGVAFQTDKSGGGLETRVQFTLFVRASG
jgi:hypothetical protein